MKLLVTGSLAATQEDLEALRALGHEITLHPDERIPVEHPEQFEGAICNSLFHYTSHEGFNNLRFLQITSAGYDRVPLDWVRQQGIRLYNVDGAYAPPMAEWTLMRILELLKMVPLFFRQQLAGVYQKNRQWQELWGKEVLLVGYGAYGREIVKRLKPFGPRITVVNRTQKEDADVDAFLPLDQLPRLLPEADILILAVGLNPQTLHLINEEALQSMKPGSLLINAARGKLIDEEALIRALRKGPLGGAALDVFETEPLPPDSPLWQLDNVLLSPHNSFVGNRNHERMMHSVLKHLQEYGEPG